jgi:hypothetical protein
MPTWGKQMVEEMLKQIGKAVVKLSHWTKDIFQEGN